MATDDNLLTDAELAMLDEDGAVYDDDEAELIEGIEQEEVAEEVQEEPSEEAPEEEYEEEAEELEPLQGSERYVEVTMTDTVPPALERAALELAKRFDDSEIEITEYLKERAIIDKQIMAYQIEEANEQKQYNAWMDAQDSFMNDNRHYTENKILFGALDSAVAEIKADPRSRGMSPEQIIGAADYLVRDAFGQPQRTVAIEEPRQRKAELKAVKQTNTVPSLPTLDRIPASVANDTGNDPFSAIERLTGDAKEAAVARLSKEEYQRYLAS